MFKYLRQTFRKENNELVNRYKDIIIIIIVLNVKTKAWLLKRKVRGKGKFRKRRIRIVHSQYRFINKSFLQEV